MDPPAAFPDTQNARSVCDSSPARSRIHGPARESMRTNVRAMPELEYSLRNPLARTDTAAPAVKPTTTECEMKLTSVPMRARPRTNW